VCVCMCARCVRAYYCYQSLTFVLHGQTNFFFVLLLYSNGWMKRSILISLRWLPLRLQNDLFIRSKRPMPFGEVYIIIHDISITLYVFTMWKCVEITSRPISAYTVILLKLYKMHKRSVFSFVVWDAGIKMLFWVLLPI